MELGLSLGDSPKPFVFLNNKTPLPNHNHNHNNITLGFCVGLSNHSASGSGSGSNHSDHEGREEIHEDEEEEEEEEDEDEERTVVVSDPPIQLDLLPLAPVPRTSVRFPWLSHHLMPEMGFSNGGVERVLDVNRLPMMEETTTEDRAGISSPNSTVSSFQMDFGVRKSSNKRDFEVEIETRASSRVSDDDENGSAARKKLRLSKQQSAFLEDSFKEHSTLNPKQKLALAKQLNLRPRQVEVWFQNRRARTKLKQTEVDCEYLRRCCETLTEENRRLQKELQELRALKTSQPFYMQLPATTLTMCPSCERVATTAPATVKPITSTATASATNSTLCLAKPRTFPFTHSQSHLHQTAS